MGWLDKVLGQPARREAAQRLDGPSERGGVQLAAQRIEPGVRPDRRSQVRLSKRSAEQWNAYSSVGEIGYVVDFFGNAMRRIRVFPAGIVKPEDGRVPLEQCPWATPQLVADAHAALDRVRSVEHGQGEILSGMAVNLKVAGAGYLHADIDPGTGLEDWRVISTEALVFQRGQWAIKQNPDDKNPTPVNLATDPIWRFWQRHPRWPGVAYSEMDRVLGHAEHLQILERAARNRGRSRAAGAGVLVMSNRYKLNGRRNPNGPQGGDVFDDFLLAGTTAMEDESAVSAFMPIMVDFDVDDARKVMHHVTFDRPLSEAEEKREEQLLRRIGQGLDGPPELVTGFHDVKFANGKIIQQETYEAHVETLALKVADILAITVMRNALLAAEHDPEVVARVLGGVDPSDLIRDLTIFDTAAKLHDALAISDAAFRRAGRHDDEDAPAPEELLRRMALKRGITTEQLTAELLANYADADVSRTLAKGEASTAADRAAAGTAGDEARSDGEEPATSPDALMAAAVSTLGARLQDLDDALAARVTGAAELAVAHALQRATSRVANRARGKGLRDQLAAGGRGLVHRVGVQALNDLGVDVDGLVTEADFADLHDQWTGWVDDTRHAGEQELSNATGQPVEAEEPDIDAGWALLLAGLLGSTRRALNSDPTAPPVQPLGETDPSAVVDPGTIRSAMARAGGAQGQTTDGGAILLDAGTRPAGGVATGEQILAAAGQAGLQLVGHTWRVGAPSAPFPPHQALAGVEFADLNDPRLANESGVFPGGARFHPQDHRGCRCTAEPRLAPTSPN